jgi:CheY-like chemotaxis protein
MTIPPAGNHKVLLVDDNRDGLIARGSLLEEIGYTVVTADTAEAGLALWESGHFDVVITDYRMPAMNGVELIRCLRAHNPNARVILLSGFVEPLGLTEENTGADAVIPKSANEVAHLLRAVKRLVNGKPLRKPPSRQRKTAPGATRARA